MNIDFKKYLALGAIFLMGNIFAIETDCSLNIPGLTEAQNIKINRALKKALSAQQPSSTKRAIYAAIRLYANGVIWATLNKTEMAQTLKQTILIPACLVGQALTNCLGISVPIWSSVALVAVNCLLRNGDDVLESMQRLEDALGDSFKSISTESKQLLSNYVENNVINPLRRKIKNEQGSGNTNISIVLCNIVEISVIVGILANSITEITMDKFCAAWTLASIISLAYYVYCTYKHPELEKSRILERMDKMLD